MSKTLHIRMYDVGFGDCFLIALPDKRTVLVDAGFHSQGKGSFGGNDLVDQIVDDVKDISGEARIDVVIATHRHQDHVYAFNSKKWEDVEVGEVWLPWVEDRSNTKATGLWKKQNRFALQLAAALPGFGLNDADRQDVEFMLWNAGVEMPGFAAAGGWSNAGALDCLHEGFARRDRTRPRFLPEKEVFPESFESPALPGVRVHVLGPPRDPDLIEELDPEADGETYRALALRAAMAGALNGGPSVAAPFGEAWQVPDDETGFQLESGEIERMVDLAQGADAVLAAEKVDNMINSTSLVLVLQIGKARLLLPGDAEWGTWKRILADSDARTLLRGASFFKVGHHGSHNATSKTLVDKVLPRKIPAMISTQQGPGNYRNNIPLEELMAALEEHEIRYARSDRGNAQLAKGFKKGTSGKWIDLDLPC
ncbi:MAG TPA: MBL fold metallo-hydrolase [Burkholderiales bacterium]|nr:MBL fold metallo-hydrolase [Burkholderiales bacterium]